MFWFYGKEIKCGYNICLYMYAYEYVCMYECTYVGRHVSIYYARIFLRVCIHTNVDYTYKVYVTRRK